MADTSDTLPGEVWKVVPSFKGEIKASNLGRVKIQARTRSAGRGFTANVPERTTFGSNDRGYKIVGLNTGRKLYVHRLVCEAFHGSAPLGKPHVAHYDGDKSNNKPANLRWASCAENREDAMRLGELQTGESHHAARLSWGDVAAIRDEYDKAGRVYGSLSPIARKWQITPAHARDIVTHRIWKTNPA